MKCLHPITLKNGLTVGCGKCLNCMSDRRDEWSRRIQLHCYGYKTMPLFVCLTYNNDHLTYGDNGLPTLVKSDIQLFIKRVKDRFDLYNTNFSYFGCGEYGDEGDQFDRPHYHLLLFGFDYLYNIWLSDVHKAENLLAESWSDKEGKPIGFVDIGVAEWSGIHYVTKYTIKYISNDYEGLQKPFTIASHGIGLPWLYTSDAVYTKATFDISAYRQRLSSMPFFLDMTNAASIALTADEIVRYLKPFVPRLMCTLPSGKVAPLPRYLRDKLYGSFENFKYDPFWVYKSYCSLRDAAAYYAQYEEYDFEHDLTAAQQKSIMKSKRIISYLAKRLKPKKMKYETI